MDNVTRFRLQLAGLALLILVWLGSTVGTVVYASTPGNAGAVLLAGFFALVGWGMFQEALKGIDHSLARHPLPRR